MKIKKKTLLIILIILVIALLGYITYKNSINKLEKICIEDKACFYVEIADTLSEREKGLSKKQSLEADKGMLFIFEEETLPGFWMKDMNFPIDVIWIGKNMKIIGIEKSLEPCEKDKECPVVYPSQEIKYVLEINSGLSKVYDFEENDSVYF